MKDKNIIRHLGYKVKITLFTFKFPKYYTNILNYNVSKNSSNKIRLYSRSDLKLLGYQYP